MATKNLMSEEQALQELTAFVNHHSLIEKSAEEVKEDLNIALIALQNGSLVIDQDFKPVLKLKQPIKTEEGNVDLDKIEFLTRVLPKDHIRLSKGLNLQKDQMEYMQKCIAHLSQLPVYGYLNKFCKFDYTVMQQISTVFM